MTGDVAVVQAIQAQMTATAAAAGGAAAAVTPPGMDGASARATVQQDTNALQYAAMFELGMEQVEEWIITMAAGNAATVITDTANSAMSAV
jgi:hypothetical protein